MRHPILSTLFSLTFVHFALATSASAWSPKYRSHKRATTWNYVSCYNDPDNARVLTSYKFDSDGMSISLCQSTCEQRGFAVAGVEYGRECWCGSALNNGATKASEDKCSMTCANGSGKCGGSYYISVYSSSSVPAPTPTSPTSSWKYVSCYNDPGNARVLPEYNFESSTLSIGSCQSTCQGRGFTMAGVEYGRECWCASSLATSATKASEDQCSMTCASGSGKCGGSYAIGVYSLEITQPSPTPTTTTTTTTTVEPTPTPTGDSWNYVSCYNDPGNSRLLSGYTYSEPGTLTTESCLANCKNQGFIYGGTEYGQECWCGSSLAPDAIKANEADCSMPCVGKPSAKCGGSYKISLYSLSTTTPQPTPGTKSVIIQMFEWSWASIAAECEAFIGPNGYASVQVSPPTEHIQGPQWWTDYQPVSYNIVSKRGNRAQFSNMIQRCNAVGVNVIVDAVINHMSGLESGVGIDGTSFTHYNYSNTYQYQDFHHCGLTPNDDIYDYQNGQQVQTCELLNLADLATETEYVRSRIAAYINDLLSLGVDGLRIDAAKHIASNDISNILGRLTRSPYITQEVIFGAGEPITPAQYVNNGNVQEFRYTYTLRDAFLSQNIAGLQNFDNRGWVAGEQANVFVANHDTERNGGSLNNNNGAAYTLAHIFSLAHPYGRPTVLSSYIGFENHDAGAPNGGVGACSGSSGSQGWLCQHRWSAISGMVLFRNAVGTAPLTNWQTSGNSRIAFSRGSAGWVAINSASTSWTAMFSSSMAPGTYCDAVSGKRTNGVCTGTSVTVNIGGLISLTVPAQSAIAIYST